jgi:hypothetical protein
MICFYASVFLPAATNLRLSSRCLHKPETDGVLSEVEAESRCARLIHLAEGDPPKREVEGADLVRHAAEEYAAWLEVLDIRS